jgi:hypothetical protein
MRPAFLAFAAGFALGVGVTPDPALAKAGFTKGVANTALVAAAKATPLKLIDYDEERCRNTRSVAQWLAELTSVRAKSIVWTGGPCQLVAEGGIDSGSDWCAQATILLKRPKDRHDRPMVEIFFDKPSQGRPSKAYAFRAFMGQEDGMLRFRKEFEDSWTERFPEAKAVTQCPGDEE